MTSTACPALFRVATEDGGEDHVCGTWATQDDDGTIRCEAGHVTPPGDRIPPVSR